MAQRSCRCEETIPPVILEGYACGTPDCWRTAAVAASFETFVANLKRKREERQAPGEPVDRA